MQLKVSKLEFVDVLKSICYRTRWRETPRGTICGGWEKIVTLMMMTITIDHDNHRCHHHHYQRCTKLRRFARRRPWCLWIEAQAGRPALPVRMIVAVRMMAYLIFVVHLLYTGRIFKFQILHLKITKIYPKTRKYVIFLRSIWKNLHLTEFFTRAAPVVPVTNMRYGRMKRGFSKRLNDLAF